MIEDIKEKWYTIRRYHCKEGFIDYFQCDSANHPDNDQKSTINLNSIVSYYRLDSDGKWIDRNTLRGLFEKLTIENMKVFTAKEIWMQTLTNLTRRITGMPKDRAYNILMAVIDRDGNIHENIHNYFREEYKIKKLPINGS